VEVPWALGPPDGRYLVRGDGAPTHVLVLATLGAPERRELARKGQRNAPPEPYPSPVTTGRATVIGVGAPFENKERAAGWLSGAGEEDLAADLAVLNHALDAYRVASADPYLPPVGREHVLVARIGFGAGEQVAAGHWTEARELIPEAPRRRRRRMLAPEGRLAGILTGRQPMLVCEQLALRARLDLDQGREREAALQLQIALDAALAEIELQTDHFHLGLEQRLAELGAQRDAVAHAAQAALAGDLDPAELETVRFTLGRIESALRARAAASS
jgi:Fe2+ transport system protein FeoA